jgi:hypothetical protein
LPTKLVGVITSDGLPGLVAAKREVGDRLQRLAQAHVVGEHAARIVGAQALEPSEAGELIRPQGRAYEARILVRGVLDDRLLQLARATEHAAALLEDQRAL